MWPLNLTLCPARTKAKSMQKYAPLFILFVFMTNIARTQMHSARTGMMVPNKDSLLAVIHKPTEDTGKVLAYHVLAAITVGTSPTEAIAFSKTGVQLGKKLKFDRGVASCLLNIAYCYSAMGKLDSALPYIDSAISYYRKTDAPGRIITAYLNRADYNLQLLRFNESMADCDTAMQYAEKADRGDAIGRVYQTIGSIYFLQGNYEQSRVYYEKAYPFFEKVGNIIMMTNTLNSIGNVYKQTKEYDRSIASFEKAINLAVGIGNENNVSMYYSNLSDVWYEKGDKAKAELNAIKAVEYGRTQKNDLQVAMAQNVLGNIYLITNRINEAIKVAQESFNFSVKNKASEVGLKAAEELAEGYFKVGNYREAYKFIEISKKLNDTLAQQKFDKDVAIMQTNFKVSEKDREILLLNKDSQLQKQQLNQQHYLMITSAAIAILVLAGVWLFINRNRLRQRMKELELRNQIAADLHDEVGSSLSSIHMLSQMAAQQDNDTKHKDILARMNSNAKETMDKMGDIVWMIKPGESEAEGLKQRMERFAYEICSSRNISTSIELDELEKVKLTMEQRKNVYLVFKEALNNAVKYSGTQKADIKITSQNKELTMLVRDYGKGFRPDTTGEGNGLNNMKNRAKALNGKLDIASGTGNGTSIQLSIPL
jgi:two-component system sensor histidine kinase UhpB